MGLAEYEGFLDMQDSPTQEVCALVAELVADVDALTRGG